VTSFVTFRFAADETVGKSQAWVFRRPVFTKVNPRMMHLILRLAWCVGVKLTPPPHKQTLDYGRRAKIQLLPFVTLLLCHFRLIWVYFYVHINYRPNLMRSISGWDDYKISFVLSVCLCVFASGNIMCPQISSDFDQTWYGGSEPEGKGPFRVWYKSDINFRFYAAILDFGLLQHWPVSISNACKPHSL
jgi:hypothetical protein